MSILKEFREADSLYRQSLKELQQASNHFTWARAITFILLMVILLGFQFLMYTALASIILAAVFLVLLARDHTHEKKKVLQENLLALNEEEELRLKGHYEAKYDGSEYLDAKHPFAQDLDVFGHDSLFGHVNRAYLKSSRKHLSQVLTTLANPQQVRERQEAIQELTKERTWRQSFQATLRSLADQKVDEEDLPRSLQAMPGGRIAMVLALVLGIATLGALIFVNFLSGNSAIAWTMIVINLLVILFFNLKLQKQALKTDYLQRFLVTFLAAQRLISSGSFQSPLLQRLQSQVGKSAIKEIRALRQIVFFLDSRGNLLWPIVNIVLLVDLHTFSMLQRWITKNSSQFKTWLLCINELETLCSMASFADLNRDFTYPEIMEEPGIWHGSEVGHPLIVADQRVTNAFKLAHPVNLVTGSNMSGKSTFLRTIGLNTLMAWVGLPVCARNLKVSPFVIYTSMRTQDDLASGTSSFYAELKRIKGLFEIEEKSSVTVLYLLDEILKGTNSHDRHDGAKGIIAKLLPRNATGFISTHDLALADEYEQHSQIKNYSFNSVLEGDRLLFDYQLHVGKCQNTNASILMRNLKIID